MSEPGVISLDAVMADMEAYTAPLRDFIGSIEVSGGYFPHPPELLDYYRANARLLRAAAKVIEQFASYYDDAGTGD